MKLEGCFYQMLKKFRTHATHSAILNNPPTVIPSSPPTVIPNSPPTVIPNSPPTVIPNLIQDLSFRIQILPDNDIFKAHFPGYPITPGAIQVRVATELLHLGLSNNIPDGQQGDGVVPLLSLRKVSNLKFIAPIYPNDEVTYSFTNIKASNGTVTASVEISADDGTRSKMFLEYAIV